MSRIVYLDFQDGNGFRDVSSLVKYDTLVIDTEAFSDNFHFAQNTASFDLIYDAVIYPLLRYATNDIICKIIDDADAIFGFYGRISPTKSRSYNGILNNVIWTLQAEDDSQQLDKDVGDICYTDFIIMNPLDPSTSIVHQLAYIAGFTLSQIGNVTISNSITKFTPNSEDDSILDILDTLLFEYGYVLNFDKDGKLTPLKWINEGAAEYDFTESNMCREVAVEDSVKDYYGAELIWYELSQATTASGSRSILLYMDDNCPYTAGDGWEGYSIPPGYSYPPETNIIDPTISGNSVVYQEYTDTAISYWTNYAIVNKLDYNYKAFDSDFSAIVATSGQWVDWSGESGILMTISGFGNKKARIVYSNPTGEYKKLYYNNIYGNVWYKSAERTLTVNNTTISGRKLDEYVSNWIFDSTTASGLVTYLAAQHAVGNTYYTVISATNIAGGAVVNVTMGDGTDQDCLVMSKKWDEKEQLYTYKLRARSMDRGVLSSQGYKTASKLAEQESITSEIYPAYVAVGADVDGGNPDLTSAYADVRIYRGGKDVTYDWTYGATSSGITGSFGSGTTANRYTVSGFDSNTTKHGSVAITALKTGYAPQTFTFVVDKIYQSDALTASGITATAPRYYGKYLDTIPSGLFLYGDTYCRYSETSGVDNRGVFMYTTSGWDRTEETKYVTTALTDISFLIAYTNASGMHIYGTAADYTGDSVVQANFAFFQSAVMGYLEAQHIKVTASGSIQGGGRYDESGNVVDATEPGAYIGANGTFLLEGTELSLTKDRARFYKGAGVQRRALQTSDESVDWLDTPDTSPATDELLRARIGRLGVSSPVLMDGEFYVPIHGGLTGPTTFSATASYSFSFEVLTLAGAKKFRIYRTTSGVYCETWNGSLYANPALIETLAVGPAFERACHITISKTDMRVFYAKGNTIQQAIHNGSAWDAPTTVVGEASGYTRRPIHCAKIGNKYRLYFFERLIASPYTASIKAVTLEDGAWGEIAIIKTGLSTLAGDGASPTGITRGNGEIHLGYVDTSYSFKEIVSIDGETAWSDPATVANYADYGGGYGETLKGDLYYYFGGSTSGRSLEQAHYDDASSAWETQEALLPGSIAINIRGVCAHIDGSIHLMSEATEYIIPIYAKLGAGITEVDNTEITFGDTALATPEATAYAIARRDADGRMKTAAPSAGNDVARKLDAPLINSQYRSTTNGETFTLGAIEVGQTGFEIVVHRDAESASHTSRIQLPATGTYTVQIVCFKGIVGEAVALVGATAKLTGQAGGSYPLAPGIAGSGTINTYLVVYSRTA